METVCSFCNTLGQPVKSGAEYCCKACGLVLTTVSFDTGNRDLFQAGYVPESFSYETASISTSMKKSRVLGSNRVKTLSNWHTRMRSASVKDKNLLTVNTELEKLKPIIGSTYLKTRIFNCFKKLLDAGYTKGQSIPTLICAMAYMVATKEGVPISFDTLVKVLQLKKKRVSKTYKALLKQLPEYIAVPDPVRFITRYAHCLPISDVEIQQVITSAKQIYPLLVPLSKMGKGPNAFAATLVWCVAKMLRLNFNERQFTQTSALTNITIVAKSKLIFEVLKNEKTVPAWVKQSFNNQSAVN